MALVLFVISAFVLLSLWRANISSGLARIDGGIGVLSEKKIEPIDSHSEEVEDRNTIREISPFVGAKETFEALGIFAEPVSEKEFFGLAGLINTVAGSVDKTIHVLSVKMFHGF